MGDFSFSGGATFSGSGSSSSWAGKQVTFSSPSTSQDLTGVKGTTVDTVKPGLSDDVLQRLALLRPPVTPGEAQIRWGRPSKFQINEPEQPSEINYTTIVTGGGGVVTDPPPGTVLIEYDEYSRVEEEVRVENPDDPQQYVIVARITRIIFEHREDGFFIALNFNHPDRS